MLVHVIQQPSAHQPDLQRLEVAARHRPVERISRPGGAPLGVSMRDEVHPGPISKGSVRAKPTAWTPGSARTRSTTRWSESLEASGVAIARLGQGRASSSARSAARGRAPRRSSGRSSSPAGWRRSSRMTASATWLTTSSRRVRLAAAPRWRTPRLTWSEPCGSSREACHAGSSPKSSAREHRHAQGEGEHGAVERDVPRGRAEPWAPAPAARAGSTAASSSPSSAPEPRQQHALGEQLPRDAARLRPARCARPAPAPGRWLAPAGGWPGSRTRSAAPAPPRPAAPAARACRPSVSRPGARRHPAGDPGGALPGGSRASCSPCAWTREPTCSGSTPGFSRPTHREVVRILRARQVELQRYPELRLLGELEAWRRDARRWCRARH